jgi:hypothetical protein
VLKKKTHNIYHHHCFLLSSLILMLFFYADLKYAKEKQVYFFDKFTVIPDHKIHLGEGSV